MHPTIEELRRLVPPPAAPNGAAGDWAACEQELQLRLPEDYKEFISTYGSGTLCGLFEISSPFSSPLLWKTNVRDWWMRWAGIYDCWGEVPRVLPYPRYPAVPGLLPWATYGDVDVLSWYTLGEPQQWCVVYDDWEEGFIEVPGLGFAGFLVAALRGTVPLPERIFGKHVLGEPRGYEPF
jgi:hypothetical protein